MITKNKIELVDFEEVELNFLKKNPNKIDEYIKIMFEEYNKDGNKIAFLAALKIVAKFKSIPITKIADDSGLNRTNLYKVMSPSGNPKFNTIVKVLASLGYKLNISPINSTQVKENR